MTSAYFNKKDIIRVDKSWLLKLKKAAEKTSFRRARLCLHRNTKDRVQEMVVAFCRDSYVRPHRHFNKSESFHIIEGRLVVLLFDEFGRITHKIKMSALKEKGPFLYRLNTHAWHSIIPLSRYVILHEAKAGPFVKAQGQYAKWAPQDTDKKGIKRFLSKINGKIKNK